MMVIQKFNDEDIPRPSILVRAINLLSRVLLTFALGTYVIGTILVSMEWGLDVIPMLLREKMSEWEGMYEEGV